MDCLTGLANRRSYEGAKERLDDPEHLPLSVIMCDVNGLKQVNDTFGHQYGDEMIRVVGKTLECECPQNNFVARIGGDEFIYLLPRTKPEDADLLIERIHDALTRCDDNQFTLSVAVGAATKLTMDENLDDIISLAYDRMYKNKAAIKKAALTVYKKPA